MAHEVKRVSAPDLRLIERCLKDNYIYNDKDVEVIFHSSISSEEDAFEISLSAKKKHTDISFRIETRVALEQHSKTGHQYPHLQINNFASDEELMKKGKLHIVLLVQSDQELKECCQGFVYIIGDILDLIENTFEITKNLKEYFFNLEPFAELNEFSNKLHELIYKSFKVNKLIYENNEIDLVQFKGKKSELYLDPKDLFKILRILLQLKFLNPILLDPILHLIEEDPQIQNHCSGIELEYCKKRLLSKNRTELEHYNKKEFINEFRK
ncbi:MAG: hypothetical protein U9R34_06175 [Nanoarchaeota archaeon]|nr:hypothetical protein [Nanoarchaeota archaeon]